MKASISSAVLGGSLGLLLVLVLVNTARAENCVNPPSGLVSWWPGDGNADDIAGDRDGTLVGDTAFVPGKVGQAFSFDGAGDYVALPGTFGGNVELTVGAWVNPSAVTDDFQAILSSPAGGQFVHFQLATGSGHGQIVTYVDGFSGVLFPAVSQTPTGVWRHIAMTVKSGDSALYVDGSSVATEGKTYTSISPTADLRIGIGVDGERPFNGLVDEVELYNRALDASEIAAIFEAGSAGKCHPPDHYLCYKIKAPKLDRFQVALADQFDAPETERIFDVKKAIRLCTPADKNEGGITDPDIHLKGYQLKLAKTDPRQPKHDKQTVTVINQFGEITLQTSREDSLLVPSLKDLEEIPPEPDPASHDVNHYKCYKVRKVVGFDPPEEVMISDQFNQPPRSFTVRKPVTLCNPVQKTVLPDGLPEPIKNPETHLMCYPVGINPKTKIDDINVTNQFGSETVVTKGEKELCVPSTKIDQEEQNAG